MSNEDETSNYKKTMEVLLGIQLSINFFTRAIYCIDMQRAKRMVWHLQASFDKGVVVVKQLLLVGYVVCRGSYPYFHESYGKYVMVREGKLTFFHDSIL
jgi:hypothetical protein